MNNNEEIINYLDSIINSDKYIKEAQDSIYENYGVKSIYKKETNTIYLYTDMVNEAFSVVSAKEHLLENFPEEMLNIKYGIPE